MNASATAQRLIVWAASFAPAVLSLGLILSAAPSSDDIAAVFPPWWSTQQAFAAALEAGPVLGSGGLGSVMIMPRADAPMRAALRQAGAWLLLDARLVGGCRPLDKHRKEQP